MLRLSKPRKNLISHDLSKSVDNEIHPGGLSLGLGLPIDNWGKREGHAVEEGFMPLQF